MIRISNDIGVDIKDGMTQCPYCSGTVPFQYAIVAGKKAESISLKCYNCGKVFEINI